MTGLQYLYDFCTEQEIQDIEDMDLTQEQMFNSYLTEHAPSETYKHQMLAILNLCRKTVFLHNAQINWQANFWYLDGLRIAEHRLNRSSSVTSVSFTEISHKENRRYAKAVSYTHLDVYKRQHTAFSCYPALRLYWLSKSQRGIGVVSLSK